jgi:hypothetical protein
MDKHIIEKKKQINSVIELLKNAKISRENYDSTNEPFFMNDYSVDFKENYNEIPEIPKSLNRHIKLMYQIIGNSKIEIYINEYTIMSLDKCLENYKHLCDNGQELVFDFGYRYLGMGHIEMISCDLSNHLLFKRNDGGSNGYDREDNYQKLLKYNSGDKKFLYFTQWKDSIIKK